jgi:hypothetical protein
MNEWAALDYVLEHDFILVTRNAEDFRGAGANDPGGLFAEVEVHAVQNFPLKAHPIS